MLGRTPMVAALCLALPPPAAAGEFVPCPDARSLPQLTIRNIEDPVIPVLDDWQIFLEDAPISDSQLVILAKNDPLIDETREEMNDRGTWVFVGLGLAAAGAAVSSTGWVLVGADEVDQAVTLPLALGGLIVGMAGVLLMSESIQTPLEPHLAPSPEHRITREQARRLVAKVNAEIFQKACDGVVVKEKVSRGEGGPATTAPPQNAEPEPADDSAPAPTPAPAPPDASPDAPAPTDEAT